MTTNPATPPPPGQPFRREAKLPVNPRRVRGGVRLKTKEGEPWESWIAERLFRVVEQHASGEALREGLEYARTGQTRRIEIEEGCAKASVQGRASRPYRVSVGLKQFTDEQRERVIEAMSDQALYAAKLLAGELPTNIEDVLAPLELRLFPIDAADFEVSCSCKEENKPWCKHVVCAAALMCERLGENPMLVFSLRGLDGAELIERLRERRVLAGRGTRPGDLYSPRAPGGVEESARPLEDCLDEFWSAGPELEMVHLPIEKPDVGYVLLRRLGSSPFPEARFPLVGLLATCYEIIGQEALDGPIGRLPSGADELESGGDDEAAPDDDPSEPGSD